MSPDYEAERLRILDMVEEGVISPGDAVQLLNALSGESGKGAATARSFVPADQATGLPTLEGAAPSPDSGKPPEEFIAQQSAFRHWWRYPLAAGGIIVILSGLMMFQAYQTLGYGFWFYVAWIPLLLGVTIALLALYSRKARWLHVRIQENAAGETERTAFSFPLPIRPAAWVIRKFGRWIPKLKSTSLDEVILALEDHTSPDKPFYVEIQDDETEERVQVFIG